MASRQKLSSLLFVLTVVFAGLIVFASITVENKNREQQSEQAQQQAQQASEQVKQVVPERAMIPQPSFPPNPPEVSPVYSYAGRVRTVDADRKILALDTAGGIKKVAYTASTKIVSRTQLTGSSKGLTAARLQKKSAGETLGDAIAINDAIIAESSEDLRGKDAFTASKIIILR